MHIPKSGCEQGALSGIAVSGASGKWVMHSKCTVWPQYSMVGDGKTIDLYEKKCNGDRDARDVRLEDFMAILR